MDDSSANVSVAIASGDIKYAAIHEFGGIIPPHEIVPDKAKALAFITGGKHHRRQAGLRRPGELAGDRDAGALLYAFIARRDEG
jgi:hypothetical protein